ncbi:MAG: hypothetical protein D6773_00345 [Alphaproteobacteria bacterium]|nr:MAG: hypothetical protein D6773_00345 [Alphaproteobacteria bacterium]
MAWHREVLDRDGEKVPVMVKYIAGVPVRMECGFAIEPGASFTTDAGRYRVLSCNPRTDMYEVGLSPAREPKKNARDGKS